jgi:thiol-disulfide isomerase/thioredoxin
MIGHTRWIVLLSNSIFSLYAIAGGAVSQAAEESPLQANDAGTDESTVIQALIDAYEQRPPYRAHVLTVVDYETPISGGVTGVRTESVVCSDGARLDTSYSNYLVHEGQSEDELIRNGRECWDGLKYFERADAPHAGTMNFVGFDENLGLTKQTLPNRGLELDGILLLGKQNFRDAFQEFGAVMETVEATDGERLYLLKTSAPHADFEVWVERDAPFRLRSVRVSRDERHEMESSLSDVVTLTITEFATVAGTELPVRGSVERRLHMRNGESANTRTTIERSQVEYWPDFESLGAFEVDADPGTVFLCVDAGGSTRSTKIWDGSTFATGPGLNAGQKESRDPIYPTGADAREQVADAIAKAKSENKRILIQYGANWCGWCYRLHDLFETDTSMRQILDEGYVVVLVNTDDNKDVAKRYGTEIRGIPFLTVLDMDEKKLADLETGLLEDGPEYDAQEMLNFLQKWKP